MAQMVTMMITICDGVHHWIAIGNFFVAIDVNGENVDCI
jgi:hypothetical protein